MKKLYALCLITLAAVVVDVLYFRAAPAQAQARVAIPLGPQVKIQKVGIVKELSTVTLGDGQSVLGFQCVQENISLSMTCFILTAGQ